MIPAEVQDFVLRNVDSIADMEALLLLRQDSSRGWDAEQLSRQLYVAPQDAQQVLERLHGRGLLARSGESYRFAPPPEDAALLDQVATLYAEQLVPVTKLIHSKAASRVRQFADAFKLKKDS